jgi:NAD(P)-dependent dehydrogenase (short-subunit alcohol dehydrogenase family)
MTRQSVRQTGFTSPVAIVTGGSMGLGFELATVLLDEGFAVSICARNEGRLHEAVRQLQTLGNVLGFVGDVADPSFQKTLIHETVSSFGRLDVLVNNASTLGDLPLPRLMDTTLANFESVFSVNTFAPIFLLQEAIPYLLAQPMSLTIGISSDAAIGGYPNWGVYGASKAALDLLYKTLASEHEESGLSAYAVDPGDMATALHEAAIPGDTGLADPADVAQAFRPLFRALSTGAPQPFPSGRRLKVRGGVLVHEEGE